MDQTFPDTPPEIMTATLGVNAQVPPIANGSVRTKVAPASPVPMKISPEKSPVTEHPDPQLATVATGGFDH
jgi:hypothetical protein